MNLWKRRPTPTQPPRTTVYTEEKRSQSCSLAAARSLFGRQKESAPQYSAPRFESTEPVGTIEVRRFGERSCASGRFFSAAITGRCRYDRLDMLARSFCRCAASSTRKRTCRSCNRSCGPRWPAWITKSFLSMTVRPIARVETNRTRAECS